MNAIHSPGSDDGVVPHDIQVQVIYSTAPGLHSPNTTVAAANNDVVRIIQNVASLVFKHICYVLDTNHWYYWTILDMDRLLRKKKSGYTESSTGCIDKRILYV